MPVIKLKRNDNKRDEHVLVWPGEWRSSPLRKHSLEIEPAPNPNLNHPNDVRLRSDFLSV